MRMSSAGRWVMAERHTTLLAEPRDALMGYLDELLREAPGSRGTESAKPPSAPDSGRSSVPAPQAPPLSEMDPTPGVAPEWARPDFQVLYFRVGALDLAVPLVKLRGVLRWGGTSITAMPNQPHWCHGAMRHRGVNMVVIATDRLVVPGRHGGMATSVGDGPLLRRILVVGDGHWGLVCDSVGEVARLRPDEVKWRATAGRRPWLAGTVTGRLSGLMDTGALADMLGRGRMPRLDEGAEQ